MTPRIQNFSKSYYIVSPIYAEPGENNRPMINDLLYSWVQREYFESYSRVVFKCNSTLFEVEPSKNVPIDTLALPRKTISAIEVENPPDEVVTYLLKEDVVDRLSRSTHSQRLVDWSEL